MYITNDEILTLAEDYFRFHGDVHRGVFVARRVEAEDPVMSLIDFAHAILDRAAECSTLSGS